jgi:hypothetical protein
MKRSYIYQLEKWYDAVNISKGYNLIKLHDIIFATLKICMML